MLPLDCCKIAGVGVVVHAGIDGWQKISGGELPQGGRFEDARASDVEVRVLHARQIERRRESIGWISTSRSKGAKRSEAIPLIPLGCGISRVRGSRLWPLERERTDGRSSGRDGKDGAASAPSRSNDAIHQDQMIVANEP